MLSGKNLVLSTETHHKAQKDVVNEDQPTHDHLFSTTALSLTV
jgi:hypothetical protein